MKFLSDRNASIIVLTALSACLFLPALGAAPLTDPDEVFYAETAREMFSRGEFLTPFIFGEPQFEKPPLYYWLVIFSYRLFGVNEFAARFPSAVAGILGVIGAYLLAEVFFGKKRAFLAGLALMTSAAFLILARACVTDMVLGVSILYVFFFFFRERYFLAAVALAVATLTKGPIGIFLPAATIAIYLIATKDFISRIRKIPLFRAGLLFLALALPWYFLMYGSHGRLFLDTFFGFHNITRFVHPEHAWGDVFYYYAPVALIGFLPWSFFLPASAWKAFTEREPGIKSSNLFLLIWFLVIFLFFSFSRTKLPTYIFPLFPALAIFVAPVLSAYMEKGLTAKLKKFTEISSWSVIAATAAGLAGFYIFAKKEYPPVAAPALFYGFIFLAGILFCVVAFFGKKHKVALAIFALSFILFNIPFSYIVFPEIAKHESSKAVSERLTELAKPSETIGAETQYRRGVAFYTGRENIPDVHRHHNITTLLLKPERAFCVIKEKNHIQLYTDPKHYYTKPTYVLYKLGKKVILTNDPPPGVPVLKVRTKDEPY